MFFWHRAAGPGGLALGRRDGGARTATCRPVDGAGDGDGKPAAPPPSVSLDVRADRSIISTASLRVQIRHAPLRIAFFTAVGGSLDDDDREPGIYGLSEKNGRLDKRGRQLGGYSYTMWNSDTFAYDGAITGRRIGPGPGSTGRSRSSRR
jgi:hypothetical protein